MLQVHLTVTEVSERTALGLRVAVCKQCFRRPPGSESLGADVPRTCQPTCELFINLARLVRTATCIDPMLGPYDRPLRERIESICTDDDDDGPGHACPLYRYRDDVIGVLTRTAGRR
jgi:hypothetical protein